MKLEYDKLLLNFAFNCNLRHCTKGKRVLAWEDGTFLMALANVAAEHRVTFGQAAAR